MEILLLVAGIVLGYAGGFYFGAKHAAKNSFTKEECAEIQEILNILNYDGREQK
jgi:hypothetical protein